MDRNEYLKSLVAELCKLPQENEWVEFKYNRIKPESIGEYISALSNSAVIAGKDRAYMVWGIQDGSHKIIGTNFNPKKEKVGNENLENWLLRKLKPHINFMFHVVEVDSYQVVVLEIDAASKYPTSFANTEYIRIGSYSKKLKTYPERESMLWRLLDNTLFELQIAKAQLEKERVLELLDYSAYFDLMEIPVPDGHHAIMDAFISDDLVRKNDAGTYDITHLGAILFAKNLKHFDSLWRKAVRVIEYKGNNKLETLREYQEHAGYAVGFNGLIEYIMLLLPAEESLHTAIRKEKTMLPKLAVRELVANAIIHQDFFATGSGVMIELFENRLEISNPGKPLIDVDRFLDAQPKSRNEKLASLMRRLGICEERGSGIDKTVFSIELEQLPAPIFESVLDVTKVTLFSYRELKNLSKQDKIRACYFHAALKYIERDYMTNTSLRKRFGIENRNGAMASRIIQDTIQSGLICVFDESAGTKARKYIPSWVRE